MARTSKKTVVPAGGWGKRTPDKVVEPAPKRVLTGWHPDEDSDPDKRPPVWSFSHLDLEGPFSLIDAHETHHREILKKLREIERKTMKEIRSDRTGFHKQYELSAICNDAHERLCELKLDDMDSICRFRFSGPWRFFGIWRGNVFHVIWWDPEHKVCPSKKKNT